MKIIIESSNLEEITCGYKGGGKNKEERKKYLDLVYQITSRNPDLDYVDISNKLIDNLKASAKEELEKNTKINDDDKEKYRGYIDIIFSSEDLANDNNYIGKVNVVSLQIIYLFQIITHDEKIWLPRRGLEQYPSSIDSLLNKNNNYLNYTKTIECLKDPGLGSNLFSRIYFVWNGKTRDQQYPTDLDINLPIYFIPNIDYLTIDEFITNYNKNIHLCGITYDYTYVDGTLAKPLYFTYHDIIHSAELYISPRIINFYSYCNANIKNKSDLYSIKLFIFLGIHEADRVGLHKSVFEFDGYPGYDYRGEGIFRGMGRFYFKHDMKLFIPKKYRNCKDETEMSEEEITKERSDIKGYLIESFKKFREAYNTYNSIFKSIKTINQNKNTNYVITHRSTTKAKNSNSKSKSVKSNSVKPNSVKSNSRKSNSRKSPHSNSRNSNNKSNKKTPSKSK
jgi:hypothetical protein